MKASPSPTAVRSSAWARRESLIVYAFPHPWLDVLEGAELSGDQQVGDHDHDRDQRQRGGERLVVGDVAEDDVADELVVGDQARRYVVAEGQREGEDGAGDDRREGE